MDDARVRQTEKALDEIRGIVLSIVQRFSWQVSVFLNRDDLMQECMIAVAEAIPAYRNDGATWKAFAARVARNRVYDLLKREINRSEIVTMLSIQNLNEQYGDTWEPVDKAVFNYAEPPVKTIRLAAREVEVLTLIGAGHGVKEAAVIMGVTYKTAKSYADTAKKKLGVQGCNAAIAAAVKGGLMPCPYCTGDSKCEIVS